DAQTFRDVALKNGMQVRMNFTLRPAGTGGGQRSGGPGLGGISPEIARQAAAAAAQNANQSQPQRGRVGGNIAAANLLQQVKPDYPQAAKDAGIQGVVVLEATISKEGKVTGMNVVSGNPLLTQAAMDAVGQWVYKPIMLNGQPVEAVTAVTINF